MPPPGVPQHYSDYPQLRVSGDALAMRAHAEPVAPSRPTSPAADLVMWCVLVGGLLAGPAAAALLCTMN